MYSPKWSRVTRTTIGIICLILFIALIIFALPLVEALSISALLAYLLNPIVKSLSRRFRVRRTWAVIIVYTVSLLVLASLPALVGTLAISQYRQWVEILAQLLSDIERWATQPIIFLGYDFSPRVLLLNMREAIGGALTTIQIIPMLSDLTTNIMCELRFSCFYFFSIAQDQTSVGQPRPPGISTRTKPLD
jgi:predicted PurR-regulated permease PerM